MDVRFVFAGLLCVYVPLLLLDAWYVRKQNRVDASYWPQTTLVISMSVSAVLASLFNFQISPGINVNFTIVCLTLAFFLLSWTRGLVVILVYVCSQIVASVWVLGHGHFTFHALTTVIRALPAASVVLFLYAGLMCVCSILMRRKTAPIRSLGFIGCLVLYCLFDYVYIIVLSHPHTELLLVKFLAFLFALIFVFVVAVQLVIGAEREHMNRINQVRLEKSELMSQLFASVAHEIRNPITAVRGFTQLLATEEYDRSTSLEFLKTMLQELDKTESVISEFLNLAQERVDSNETDMEFSHVVAYAVDVLMPYALSQNVQVNMSLGSGIYVRGNRGLVIQAILNVLKNAIEATSEKKTGTVEINLKDIERIAKLTISDSGKGMSPEVLARLGEPYYSTKVEGTGLGITLTYKVINEIGGHVSVQSEEGVGTTFTISIPSTEQQWA